ncbi:MAG: histidinol dehydrogenase [Acidimicrobiia bacterium]
MLTRLDLRGVPVAELAARLPRPSVGGDEPITATRAILAEVRARGDDAIREYTERFDGVRLDSLRVTASELAAARSAIGSELRTALEVAADRVREFHAGQVRAPHTYHRDGIEIRSIDVPVDRAGCYVPGGRAIYPSTVLMTAVPAKVAGVSEVALCVPPDRSGAVPAPTLAAAAIAGVDEVYRFGGAQAIAAMAYGTQTIRPVDVIVGPGNVYVAIAKREVAAEGLVGVPSAFTGPSEVVVIADDSAVAEHAAVDIVLQAEHGPNGLAWLITWSAGAAAAIDAAVTAIVEASPRRADIEATLANSGYACIVDSPEAAMVVSNVIAPEHLELMSTEADMLVGLVRHAGAVFTGPWSPASIGDYVAGPSHVLPTFGSARFGEALTVADFTKQVHVITASRAGFEAMAPHVVAIAEAEGLAAHADSIRRRL